LDVARALAPDDLANLAEAAAWALDHGPGEVAARAADVARVLARFDPSRAPDALVDLLERALALAEPAGAAPRALAAGHGTLGRAWQLRGRLGEARRAIEHALALAGEDQALAGELWADLGVVHHQQ